MESKLKNLFAAILSSTFIRYIIVGVLSTATHVGTLVVQLEWLGVGLMLATAIAFTASLGVSFSLNYLFAFRANTNVIESAMKFLLVCFSGLVLNMAVMEIFVNRVGLHYGFAILVAVVVVTINNFSLHYFWTFKKPAI